MGMTDSPVIEMGHFLQGVSCLGRPLDAGNEIPDQSGQHQPAGRISQNPSAVPPDGQEKVYQDGKNGNDHDDRVHNCDILHPPGNGCLDDVVATDMGIKSHQRPETDQ